MKLNAKTINKIIEQLEKGEITEDRVVEMLMSLMKGEKQ